MTARTAAQLLVRSRLDRRVTTDELHATIVELAVEFGWSTHHAPDHSPLMLLRPPRALFVELQTEIGKVSTAQARVLERLQDCGFEVAVWRPSQLNDVIATLRKAT